MIRTVVVEVRSLPLGVWAVTLLFLGITLLGTFLRPLFSIPDERYHVDMIFAATDGDGYPRVGERDLTTSITASGRLLRQDVKRSDPLPDRPADAVDNPCGPGEGGMPACAFEPTFAELADAYSFPGLDNRMTAHAPAYYLLTGQIVATATTLTATDLPHDTQVWLYRLVSVLLISTIPLLAALGARELGAGRHGQVVAALAMTAVTGLVLRNGPIVNNDNLLGPLLAGVLVVLARISVRGATPRRLVAAGILLGLALITKGFAIAVALAIPVCLLLVAPAELPSTEQLRLAVRGTLVIAVTSLLAGGWWVVRNLVLYGSVSENSFSRPPAEEPVVTTFLEWAVPWYSGVIRSGLEQTGVFLTSNPAFLVAVALGLFAVLVLAARSVGWRTVLALSLPMLVTVAIWTIRIYDDFFNHGQLSASQARYYFPTLTGVAMLLGVGADRIARRSRVAATVTVGVALAAVLWNSTVEVRSQLAKGWSPDRSIATGWERVQLWAPVPFDIAWIAIGIAALGAVLTVVATVRSGPSERAAADGDAERHALAGDAVRV